MQPSYRLMVNSKEKIHIHNRKCECDSKQKRIQKTNFRQIEFTKTSNETPDILQKLGHVNLLTNDVAFTFALTQCDRVSSRV